MRRHPLHLICWFLLSGLALGQDGRPAVTYGRVTMSYSREYEWMDLLGIKANELTANIADPVFGARLRIEVWEPGDQEKPKWSATFGSVYTFKEKTPMNCTFRIYFVPPKLRDLIQQKAYPAWLTWQIHRPGDWTEDNPVGWVNQEQLTFPENYLAIEGYRLSVSPNLYEIHAHKFDRPLPFFHYSVANESFSMKATPEETRKANPHAVHIIGWLEPLLEENDFHHPKISSRESTQQSSKTTEAPLLAPGVSAPKWELQNIDGGKLSSEDLRGKITVINFWASWCGHCLAEFPTFVDLQQKYGEQGVQFVTLNVDRQLSVPGLQRFVKWNFVEKPLNFPILLAPESVEKSFGNVDSLPTTYLVDAFGKIVYGCKGEIPRADLEKRLQELLALKK